MLSLVFQAIRAREKRGILQSEGTYLLQLQIFLKRCATTQVHYSKSCP
uniref:Uncharacterized protein n=1 Tax=Rhizophora mucronata TaxID=61149 RepID=A0A2P2P179_RHIMU